MNILIAYLATLVPLVVLDFMWITLSYQRFYVKQLGSIFGNSINYAPIGIFYPLYAFVILMLAVTPALASRSWTEALWHGALLGLAAYSAYDLTNQATISGWPTTVTIVDIAWGTVVTALASTIAYMILVR